MRRFFHHHGNARVGKVHRNAAAHCACADDCGFGYRKQRRAFRNVRNLGDFAFTEEGVNHRFRLIGEEAFLKEFAFARTAFKEGQLRRGFNRINRSNRSHHPACSFFSLCFRRRKNRRVRGFVAELFVFVACLHDGLIKHRTRERFGTFQQIAFDNLVNDACG